MDTNPDAAGIQTTPITLVEGGSTAEFTVRLATRPTHSVFLIVENLDTSDAIMVRGQNPRRILGIRILQVNWNMMQTVTVFAPEDVDTDSEMGLVIDIAGSSSDPNYNAPTLPNTQLTVNVIDNDTNRFFSLAAIPVREGQPAALTITLGEMAPPGGLEFTVTTDLAASTSASTADVGSAPAAVTVPAGQTEAVLTIPTTDDDLVEGTETFTVTIEAGIFGWRPRTSGAGAATVTIEDNDFPTPAALSLRASTLTPAEGTAVTVTAVLDNPAPGGDTIVTLTPGGTAAAGGGAPDYRLSSDTITIAAGEREGMATLTIVSDSVMDGGETILLAAASTNPVLTAVPITLTITDVSPGGGLDEVSRLLAPELSRLLADGAVAAVARRIARAGREAGEVGGTAADAAASAANAASAAGVTAVAGSAAAGSGGAASGAGDGAGAAGGDVAGNPGGAVSGAARSGAAVLGALVHQHTLAALSEGQLSLDGLARLLDGSEFVLPLPLHRVEARQAGSKTPAWLSTLTLWGGGEYRRLENDSGNLDWEADTVSARVGLDARIRDHWLLGAAVAWGRGTVDDPGEDAGGGGGLQEYRLTLGSVLPYLAWTPKEGVQLWLSGGYGQGTVRLRGEAQSVRSDAAQHLAAGGARVRLLARGRTRLHLRLEGQGVWLDIDGSGSSQAAQAGGPGSSQLSAHKVQTRTFRALLEGRRTVVLARGVLTPALELGVRHDGGDGDSGAAALVGGELRYRGLRGLQAEAGGELLLGRSDYREWGLWGLVSWEKPDGRGWSLRLSPRYGPGYGLGHGPDSPGASAGGLGPGNGLGNSGRLWQRGSTGPGASTLAAPTGARLDLRIGYGLAKGPRLLAPYSELSLTDEARRLRLGVQWRLGRQWYLDLAGERLERTGANTASNPDRTSPEHRLLLEGRLRY